MDKENNNMEDFIEIKDEKQQQSQSTDSNIEQKIREVYLNKSEISEEKSDKNQQDNIITNFDSAKSDANQNQQEKNKHLKFRVLIALFGLLGIIMILYFLFPQIDVTNQEILNTQQTTIDNQNNPSNQNFNQNNQNLNTGQSSTSGSETDKEMVLEEHNSVIGKEARVG
ncbi:MAG: hypothetical protein N3E37_04490, partial [Candidatus Micrarchaeota archaeon]|nr:hypothetical protein [Candidatus Micrarchaeota archaeon]